MALLLCSSWPARAKIPGAVHCYNEICHRVRTIAETDARKGMIEPLVASFYDSPGNDRFNPRLETSSGAVFDPGAPDNAASPVHPDGTVLLIWSPATHGAAVVRINNAGPYHSDRTLDVSRGTAERLGFAQFGTAHLMTIVIAAPSEPETRYERGRVYPPVRGYLGTFDNLMLASVENPNAKVTQLGIDALLPLLAAVAITPTVLTSRDATSPPHVRPLSSPNATAVTAQRSTDIDDDVPARPRRAGNGEPSAVRARRRGDDHAALVQGAESVDSLYARLSRDGR